MSDQSAEINELASALAMAQAEMGMAAKDGSNPHFNSSFASLASMTLASREHLTKHGLSVSQPLRETDKGPLLVTKLLHKSGQWLSSELYLRATKTDSQGQGSAITYARRQTYAAIIGLAVADDDAEEAVGRGVNSKQQGRSYDDLANGPKKPFVPKKKDPGTSDLDVPPPPSVRSIPNDLCTFYPPFNQYHGVSFREMPDQALKHIGDHIMPMAAKETKPNRQKWFDAIKEGLINEIADRPPVKPGELR